jgi:hypothetical protein
MDSGQFYICESGSSTMITASQQSQTSCPILMSSSDSPSIKPSFQNFRSERRLTDEDEDPRSQRKVTRLLLTDNRGTLAKFAPNSHIKVALRSSLMSSHFCWSNVSLKILTILALEGRCPPACSPLVTGCSTIKPQPIFAVIFDRYI